jgi:hypothetical protein
MYVGTSLEQAWIWHLAAVTNSGFPQDSCFSSRIVMLGSMVQRTTMVELTISSDELFKRQEDRRVLTQAPC